MGEEIVQSAGLGGLKTKQDLLVLVSDNQVAPSPVSHQIDMQTSVDCCDPCSCKVSACIRTKELDLVVTSCMIDLVVDYIVKFNLICYFAVLHSTTSLTNFSGGKKIYWCADGEFEDVLILMPRLLKQRKYCIIMYLFQLAFQYLFTHMTLKGLIKYPINVNSQSCLLMHFLFTKN